LGRGGFHATSRALEIGRVGESGVEIDSLERNGVVCSQYRSSSLQSVPWVRWITGIIATVKKALSGMGVHRC
jgi:hypothetical protein